MNKVEVRYSTEFYSNALYGEYNSMDEARTAMQEAVLRALAHGDVKLAKSFHLC